MNDATSAPAMAPTDTNEPLRRLGRFLSGIPDCGQDHAIIMHECATLATGCPGCELNPANRAG